MDAGTISILLQARDEMSGVLDSAAGSAGGFGSKMGIVSAAAGVALLGIGVAAVKGLASVGESFDEAYDTIRVGTGATGEALAGLEDDFKSVVSNVPTDFATASTAVADLNTRLGLTGQPLQDMATQFINLGRIAGEDTPTLIAAGTRAFGDWAIATEDQSGALDHMFRVSQSTGIGVSELMGKVVQFGAPLRAMGFSFEESTAMMGKWEKEGVNTELVLGSMRIAMGKFADAGIPMREGLDQTIAAIQELGPGAEATSLAMDVFGARAGPDMAAAILEGRFAIDDLMTSLDGSGDTINGVAAATDDWREKLQILKNKGMVALEPVANFVFGSINTAVDLLILTIGYLSGALGGPLRSAFSAIQTRAVAIAGALQSIGLRIFEFVKPAIQAVGPFVERFKELGSVLLSIVAGGGLLGPLVMTVVRLASAFGKGGLSGALEALPGILQETFAKFARFYQLLGGIAADVGKAILDAILGVDWGNIASKGVNALVAGWEAVTDLGSRLLSWASDQITGVDWVGIASDVGGDIVDGVLSAVRAVADFGSRFAGWVGDQVEGVDWAGQASAIGTAITDGAMTAIQSVTDWGDRFATWATGQLSGIDWSGVGTAIITGITTGLTSAVGFGQSLVDVLSPSLQSADWAGPASGIVSGISGAMASMDWSGMVSGLTTGVTTAVTALAPLWDSISIAATTILPALVSLWGTLSASFSGSSEIMTSLSTLWAQIVVSAQQLWAALVPLQPVLIAIGAVIGGIIVVAIGLLMGVLGGLVGLLAGALPGAIQMVSGMITSLAGVIQVATAIIVGVLGIVTALLRGDWSAAWQAAKTMVQGVVDGIRTIVQGMVTAITGLISGLVGGVVGMISGFVDSVIGFFKNLYHELVGGSIVPDLINDIITWISKLPGEVLGLVSGFVTEAIGFFAGLATDGLAAITGMVTDMLISLGGLVTDGVTKAGELATGVVTAATTLATDALTAITGFVTDSLAKLGSLALDGATQARALATNVLSAVTGLATDALTAITGFVTDGLTSLAGFVTDAVSEVGSLPGKAVAALGDLSQTLLSAGGDLIGGFIKGIQDKIPSLDDVLGGITSRIPDLKGPPEKDAILLRPSGNLIMDGLIAGIRDRVPEMEAELTGITDMISAGLGPEATADDIRDGWLSLLGDLEGIISGDVQGGLTKELFALQEQLTIAMATGAPQTVIDALNASMSSVEAQLAQVGAVYQQAIQQGMVDAYTPEMVAGFADKLDGIIQGTLVPELQASLDEANARVATATALGWNAELVAAYQAEADELAESLAQANSDTAAAAAAGLLSPDAQAAYNDAMGVITEIPLDQIRALIPLMENGGTELIDSLVGAIADGRLAVDDAWSLMSDMSGEQIDIMRDQLETLEEQLTVQLAQAWLDGTDPTGIAANLAAIQDLLSQTADVATDTADTVDDALRSLNAPSGDGGGGGGGGGGLAYGGRSADPSGTAGGGSAPAGDSGPLPGVGAGPDLSSDDRSAVQEIGEIIGKEVAAAVRESLAGVL